MQSILLYKIVQESKVSEYLRKGIECSPPGCNPEYETEPRRNHAVFAYTLKTLRKVAAIEGGNPEYNKVLVFKTDPSHWFVGDLYAECSPHYKETMDYLPRILDNPWKEDGYREMECWWPDGWVPPHMIVEVKNVSDFVEIAAQQGAMSPVRPQVILNRMNVLARTDTPIDRMERNIAKLKKRIEEAFS